MQVIKEQSQIKEHASVAIKAIQEKLDYKQLLIIKAKVAANNKQWKKLDSISKKYDELEEDIANLLDELLGDGAGKSFKNNIYKKDNFGSPFVALNARCDSISGYLIALRDELREYPERAFERWNRENKMKAIFKKTNKEIIVQALDRNTTFEAGTNMFRLCKAMKRVKVENPIEWGTVYYKMFGEEAHINNKKCWRTIYNAVIKVNEKISKKLGQEIKLFDLKNGTVIRLF